MIHNLVDVVWFEQTTCSVWRRCTTAVLYIHGVCNGERSHSITFTEWGAEPLHYTHHKTFGTGGEFRNLDSLVKSQILCLWVTPALPYWNVLPSQVHRDRLSLCEIRFNMAPRAGFEPTTTESKSVVLPLHHQGTYRSQRTSFCFKRSKLLKN